jgi:hypothetical protein
MNILLADEIEVHWLAFLRSKKEISAKTFAIGGQQWHLRLHAFRRHTRTG